MHPAIAPVHVRAWSAASALGTGREAMWRAVRAGHCGLTPLAAADFGEPPPPAVLDTVVGRVAGLEAPLPERWARWDCRNNRLAWRALQADGLSAALAGARATYGRDRIAVVMGTSTASIAVTEAAYRRVAGDAALPPAALPARLQSLDSLTAFLQEALDLRGPGLTVSTACSSSARVFCTAERLLRLGVADAVLAGGVDSLCASTLFGFHALALVAPEVCRPFDAERAGINLGEAAGFALLERGRGRLQLLGYGDSSDGHHLSAPDPEGAGAERALDEALARAQLTPAAIDHVQLHGTGTPLNDAVESRLLARRYTAATTASSTKGMVGHTLGAAGALGSAFCWLALETGSVSSTVNTRRLDPELWPHIALEPSERDVGVTATHNFAFGGSNCVLLWGDGERAGAASAEPQAAGADATAVHVLGPAFLAPGLPDWQALCTALARDELPDDANARLPQPELLGPGDRRRAPASVALALEAGRMATAAAGAAPADLAAVFASAHGDLGIVDSLSATLASAPSEVSPTRFLHSIHNAPAGLWSMATASRTATSAVAGGARSFAAGLLEALLWAAADHRAVLFVAYETAAPQRLRATIARTRPAAFAAVLAPAPAQTAVASLTWSLDNRPHEARRVRTRAGSTLADDGMGSAMAYIEMLAREERGPCPLALPGGQSLALELSGDGAHASPPTGAG